MREYPGQSLAALLAEHGPLPMPQWLELARQLLQAVGVLHRRNLLHRDIKPENLHLGSDGQLRLLDFGLAYCPGLSEDPLHELPGTPSYIAPEAFDGQPPSPRQDLYAVGVTLYHLLTGHYPTAKWRPSSARASASRSTPRATAPTCRNGCSTTCSRHWQRTRRSASKPPNTGCCCSSVATARNCPAGHGRCWSANR